MAVQATRYSAGNLAITVIDIDLWECAIADGVKVFSSLIEVESATLHTTIL